MSRPETPRGAIIIDIATTSKLSLWARWRKGGEIYQIGGPKGSIIAMVDGWSNIMIAPLSTPPILLHVSCAGAWGGDTANTLDIDRVIGVTARTDCKVAHFPFHKLQVLTQHMAEVWAGLARLTAGHIKLMMTIVACGLEKNSNNRVSLNLLRLIGDGQMFGLGSEGDPKELPLSQSELAEMTSLSRNSVEIILKDLEAIGAIEVSYRNIKILNCYLFLHKAPNG